MNKLTICALVLALTPTWVFANVVLSVLTSDETVLQSYTFEELDDLEQTSYSTGNAFIDDEAKFSGPLLRVVLVEAGVELRSELSIALTAVNDYKIEIPMSDIMNYDVLLATRRNDETMSVREKGPIWVMYPVSAHEELQDAIYSSRLIWQLKSVQVIE